MGASASLSVELEHSGRVKSIWAGALELFEMWRTSRKDTAALLRDLVGLFDEIADIRASLAASCGSTISIEDASKLDARCEATLRFCKQVAEDMLQQEPKVVSMFLATRESYEPLRRRVKDADRALAALDSGKIWWLARKHLVEHPRLENQREGRTMAALREFVARCLP